MAWPFLKDEPDVSEELRINEAELRDLLGRETFFRALIEQHTHEIEREYDDVLMAILLIALVIDVRRVLFFA